MVKLIIKLVCLIYRDPVHDADYFASTMVIKSTDKSFTETLWSKVSYESSISGNLIHNVSIRCIKYIVIYYRYVDLVLIKDINTTRVANVFMDNCI